MVKSFDAVSRVEAYLERCLYGVVGGKKHPLFGFSFPSSDALINEVLRSAFMRQKSVQLSVVDVSPEKPATLLSNMLGSNDDSTIQLYRVHRLHGAGNQIGYPLAAPLALPDFYQGRSRSFFRNTRPGIYAGSPERLTISRATLVRGMAADQRRRETKRGPTKTRHECRA